MNKPAFLSMAMTAALISPVTFSAENAVDLQEIRQSIEQMKQQYEAQIRALEQRVEQAEARAAAAETVAEDTRTKMVAVEQTVQARPRSGDNSFNPAISLVLQGGLATYSQDPEDFHAEGFPLGGEAGLHDEGLSMWETELTASANVDNYFYGKTTLGLHSEDGAIEVDVEEAFVDTLSLPGGLGLRFGRFYSAMGYLNEHHTHAWDFADAPLAYQTFLGKQYADDGIRASWLAPVEILQVEVGVEALRGGSYPGGGNSGDLGAVQNVFATIGGDVGLDHSWQLGVSQMNIDVEARTSGGHAHAGEASGPGFNGDSDLTGIDTVWKTQLAGGKALIFQGEYFLRDEDGLVTVSEDAGDAVIDYDGEQDGWYLQGVYQFAPQWRAGVRYDRLTADNTLTMVSNATGEGDDDIFEESGFESTSHDPHRWGAMIDWTPSEFSRVRLQYARDKSREVTDDQLYLQYIMTLGAHGAHRY